MSKVIVIGSQKGGVGKTTTTLNLAYSLCSMGKKVLAIDLDSQANLGKYGNVQLIFPIDELSVQIDKCKSSVKIALKELDDEGLLVRRSGGFSKPNHLYVKIPSDEIGLQPVENKAVEKMALMESEKQPSSGRKNGCTGVGNVAPSKVTEKYKSNKYYEVNYCYGKGESL